MSLHLGARFHAWWHGLSRPSEIVEIERRWSEAERLFLEAGIADDEGRSDLIVTLTCRASDAIDLSDHYEQEKIICRFIAELLDYEGLLLLPDIETDRSLRTIAQWWDIREEVERQLALVRNFEATKDELVQLVSAVFVPLYSGCPALLAKPDGDELTIKSALLSNLKHAGEVVESILAPFLADEDSIIAPRLADRLMRNLVAASGGNPAQPSAFQRAHKLPGQCDAREPDKIVRDYLAGTPMLDLFDQEVDFVIPTKTRFEHHHLVAGSGHGKTQTLQYLIAHDLEAVAAGNRSIVVIDSQGDLISNISKLDVFAPDGPLHDRIVIIDPSDVEWPVSLNLFDVGQERFSGYAPLERERLTNSILELYDFVLGSLLSAEMTQKQNVIFRYVTRLMLHIPDATIHTLRRLMEPGSEKEFAPHIAKLSGTARDFFETEFASREFEQTKKQVLRRLWGILENQTFERMFAHPRSKLDLFSEINAGKVILINTAKDLLKEQGTEIFGRFFIALIAQAAQERATLPVHKRTPTLVYIDEAQDYFDRNIGLILAQARKQNVGMVLAHQYLGQLEPKLQEAFAANTAIKFAGGVSAKDARALASMLGTSPEVIEAQPKGSFMASLRGHTMSAAPLHFPFGHMEAMPKMTADEAAQLREVMRSRYAIHYSALNADGGGENVAANGGGDGGEIVTPPQDQSLTLPAGHIDTDASDQW